MYKHGFKLKCFFTCIGYSRKNIRFLIINSMGISSIFEQIVTFFSENWRCLVPLKQSRTVSSEWYTNSIVCHLSFKKTRTLNAKDILKHNRMESDTNNQTTLSLSTQNIDLLRLLHFSPDFASKIFFISLL